MRSVAQNTPTFFFPKKNTSGFTPARVGGVTVDLSDSLPRYFRKRTTTDWLKFLFTSDTAGRWVSTIYKKPGTDSIFQNKGGTITYLYRVDSAGGGGSGETNTASNVGSGVGVYKTKSGVDLQFKSITGGVGVTPVANTNDVQLGIKGYNGWQTDTVTTTDATQTTIATIATAGSAYYSRGTLEVQLDASSANAGISGTRLYRFVNNAGTMTITDITEVAADELSTLTTASWVLAVSGNNLLVKVTGQVSQTLTWVVTSKIHWSQTAL